MTPMRSIKIVSIVLALLACASCTQKPKYGVESKVYLSDRIGQTWAVAPAVNLSGQMVDPLLQADLLYQQLQEVNGLTVIPVNRVVEVYASLHIEKVQTEEQAALVCDLLGCDGLVVPTITAYDPYDPPKMGASLQLFQKPGSYARPENIDPRELSRMAAPAADESLPDLTGFVQAVGMYDAANGSVRLSLLEYAKGRNDPLGPMKEREYLASMDRYCGFVYHELIVEILDARAARTRGRTG